MKVIAQALGGGVLIIWGCHDDTTWLLSLLAEGCVGHQINHP